jgi:hypothetical protein
MGIAEIRRDPDDRLGTKPRCVGEDLSKVPVVRLVELVFDQHDSIVLDVAGEDVRAKLIHRDLAASAFELETERVAQPSQVFEQPWREVAGLALERLADIDVAENTE